MNQASPFLCILFFTICFACADDSITYDPASSTPVVCFENEECPEDSRICRANSECPDGFRCNMQGRCTDSPPEPCIDNDDDGYGENCPLGFDCDDDNYFTNPGANEICNDIDENCNGVADDGLVCDDPCVDECTPGDQVCIDGESYHRCREVNDCAVWLPPVACSNGCVDGDCAPSCYDADGDGFGVNCPDGDDCNDRNPYSFPGNPEICDGYDNDCDGVIDNGDICNGRCDPPQCELNTRECLGSSNRRACAQNTDGCIVWIDFSACTNGQVCDDGDCYNPEQCLVDNDNDNFGPGCPAGNDCNDFDSDTSPLGTERCDGQDNNCDGVIDEGLNGCTDTACAQQPTDSLAFHAATYGYACPGRDHIINLVDSPASGQVFVNVWQPLQTSPLVLSLFQGSNMVSTASNTIDGTVFTIPNGAGPLSIRLRASQATAHPFAASWAPSTGTSCPADPWETNNSPGRATPIFPNSTISGALCTNDLDFYRLSDVTAGTIIHAELTYDNTSTILLEIWKDNQPITPDQSINANRRVTHFRANSDGDYIITVRAISSASAAYVLAVGTQSGSSCAEDGFEGVGPNENDTLDNAAPLLTSATVNATLCPGDIDVFSLGTFTRGESIDVSIGFDVNTFNLDAYLFRDDLDGLFQLGNTDRSPEVLPTNVSLPGEFFVLVIGRSATDSGDYSITAQ